MKSLEAGQDNSPGRDKPLKNITVNNDGVPAERRSNEGDYFHYVRLVDLFPRNN